MKNNVLLKEPRTFEQQLEILISRNMIVDNNEESIQILKRTNYYRLTAYALQFNKDNNYNYQISFDTMYKLYKFDNELRHLILSILEYIEISLRTYMSYKLSIKYGPEAHKNSSIFKDIPTHKRLLDDIEKEIRQNRNEPLVKHHMINYNEKFPIWVLIEIFSFGMLSRTYSNLQTSEQKEISRECFNTNFNLLESWLQTLSYVRNTCAHYGRLYNKDLKKFPMVHRKYNSYKLKNNKLFVAILAIKELTINTDHWDIFQNKLKLLISDYINEIDLNCLGFPNNWEDILT